MICSKTIEINTRIIGQGQSPYVIAEISANHNGSLERAIQLLELAKSSGADAVKLQTYTPDTMTLNSDAQDFQIIDGLWAGKTLYELYQDAHTPWQWHKPLFQHAKKIGITIFSSPFDKSAVDLLEDLNTPAYKIASFELVDLPLIRYVASTGKPMIMSTGMANVDEISSAIEAAQEGGCKQLAILHCVSGYPAPTSDYNLMTIPDMISRWGLVTGLSDHTMSDVTAIASVALGASIIEKHFTLNREGSGPDDSFSLTPSEFKSLCEGLSTAWGALGSVNYQRKTSEEINVKFRRSLYFVKDLKSGDYISVDSVRSIRPGYGLPPKHIDSIVGKQLKVDVKIGTPVSWDYFK